MRVLHCIRALDVGGSQKQLAALTSLLAERGWEVHVAVLHEGVFESLLDARTLLHRVASHGNADPLVLARLVRLFRKLEPDIVQTWLPQMDIVAGAAALLCRVPWIIAERSSALGHGRRWPMRLRERMGKSASGIVANSKGGLDFWRPHTRHHEMHRVIPNAVLVRTGTRAHEHEGEPFAIVYVGRLSPEKRIAMLLEAIAIARRELPVTAVICGDGPQATELRALTDRLALAEAVQFTGHVTSVATMLDRATLFVSLSRYEGSPNSVQEAVVAGVPVLLSDIAAHRDLLDESSALFVAGGDPDAVGAAIVSTLRHPRDAQARANAATQRAREWSPDFIGAAYDTFYREVLAGRT